MTLFERFEQHKYRYSYLLVALYLLLNNTINASSVWMEHSRNGSADIAFWEPFVWEYTSALAVFVLLPVLVWLFRHNPPRLQQIKRQLAVHITISIVFSLAHVLLMVLLRQAIYAFNGLDYHFGPWPRELWYEYRKDAWGYLFYFVLFHMAVFIYRRLKGEANDIAENEEQAVNSDRAQVPEHFLVRKLDKEFLVKVADIEWLESSGNYVNLHINGRIYPLRSTLAQLSERLKPIGFSRIHRSFAVNHHAIDSISYQSSGDGEIQLKSGKKLSLSRRYKDAFKQTLA